MPKAIDVPAEGPDLYKNVTMAIDLPDDRFITAVDFEPSARRVVHHALFFSGPASAVIGDDELIPGLGGGQRGGGRGVGAADQAWGGLGGWVPGMTAHFFPEGIAQSLPKHTNLVVQLHLHPSGKAEHEQGQLAIYFAKTPPKKSMTGIQVPPMFGYAAGIDIPAGEKAFTIHDSFTLPVDQNFDLRYQPHTQPSGDAERELEEDDLTTAFYEHDEIDLDHLLREQFHLALPMKPLCSDSCHGLCPICGTNLNRETCACTREWQDPRLDALRALTKTPIDVRTKN